MNYVSLCWLAFAGLSVSPLALARSSAEPPALQPHLEWLDTLPAAAKRNPDAASLLHNRYPQLAGVELRRSTDRRNRVEHYRPQVAGIDIYGARLSLLRDANGEARASGGSLPAKLDNAALPAFALDAKQALQQALRSLDIPVQPDAGAAKRSNGDYLRIDLTGSGDFTALRPARIKPVWYPTGNGLTAAYYAEVLGKRAGESRPLGLALVVSAEDGRVLRRQGQIHDLQAFDYRVFANAQGRPYVDPYGYTNPHPTGQANGYKPTVPAPMNLVHLSDAGTGDPWLAATAEETRGNNVDAFFNADTIEEDYCSGEGWGPGFNAAEGDFRARTTAPFRFDYAYDVDTTRNDYDQCRDATAPIPTGDIGLNAKIVQGFYATNWLHDLFYAAGYDEAAGNSQTDNYGRGGIADDPLLVHAASLTTFTYAPTDGESPALTLGYNIQSRSHRDVSAFDLGVLAHEWAHTMFGRLTTSDYYGQPGALNEGTADFVGLFVTVREQDRWAMPGQPAFSAAYAVGAYMNLDYDFAGDDLPIAGSPTNPDNSYYHGIRRYPYSSDLQRNPLTLRHISQDNPVPAGSQPYDWKARSLVNAEIHTAGEVWTTALWQCARNVLAAAPSAQFETRHRDFLRWLVGGLQLFPTDATYTEARNALLFAIRADSEADYRRCRSGFAERGFGSGALSPPRKSFSLRGVEESFRDLDHALSIVDVSLRENGGDGDGVLDRNENGDVLITLRNSGFAPLSRISLTVPPLPGLYDLPDGIVVDNIALAPEETRVITLPVRVRSGFGPLTLPVQAFAWDTQHPEAFALTVRPFEFNVDLRRDRNVDNLAYPATFAADWIRGFDDYPHGCALYVCLGAEGDDLAEVLDWQRRRYNGSWAYVMSDAQLSLNTWLATQPFTVSATTPLEFVLRHDFDFDRSPVTPGYGRIEIRIDGGDWQDAAPLLSAGSASFSGISGGWRDDTLRFGAGLAGHQVQLRLRTRVISTFRANDAHWAVARVEIRGAAQPVFSSVVADQ